MARADQIPFQLRIVIRDPVPGVLHSLQSADGAPLDPKRSSAGESLAFECSVRIAAGPKFFGDQVRREGPVRRFVYIRIGAMAGDIMSSLSRRMKIDIHDLDAALVDHAMAGGAIEISVNGTGKDGTPACATVPAIARRKA
ncbi:DUF5990 family protein [Sphingomonas sp. ST-64]|uniref:DUF5990 family protein n=1 Tax=Sphingomonas plantiphila TaxID=3163295 RepID=A0ABW8YJW0_9SPHN